MSVVDELYQNACWPRDKPTNQLITFTRSLEICQKRLPLVWAMLPDDEIQKLRDHSTFTRTYKNMICLPSPHPMALWMTALYNRVAHPDRPARWFPQYLDLATGQGRDDDGVALAGNGASSVPSSTLGWWGEPSSRPVRP